MVPLGARARALLTPAGVFVALVPIAFALILYLGRHTTFFFDDWSFVTGRRDWSLSVFLHPYNDHLSLVPVLIYKLLFVVAGLDHYWAYRVVLASLHVLCSTLVFLLVRRRLGDWEAVIAAGLVLFMGSAADDLLWPFQIGFLLSVAGGLGAWLGLLRDDRRGDLVATGGLAVALASSSLGVPIAIGLAVELLLAGGLRRRWWVVAGPVALYAVWYAGYGHSATHTAGAGKTARWALDVAASAFGGLAGGGVDPGRPLLAIGVLAAVVLVAREHETLTPRLVGLLACVGSFWVLLTLSRATIESPQTSRYVYLGVVVIALAGAELLRNVARPPAALAVAGILLVVSVVLNVQTLRDEGRYLRLVSAAGRVELGTVELARPHVAPEFVPRDVFVHAGDYLAAVADLGSSPAIAPAEILSTNADSRRRADLTLQQLGAVRLSLVPTPVIAPNCRVFSAGGSPGEVEVPADGHRLLIQTRSGATDIRVRRFGDDYANPSLGDASSLGGVYLVTKRDPSQTSWHVQLHPTGRVRACDLGRT